MNVLIVTDTFPPEKVGSYRMNDLGVNLSKDGFNVTVLCPPPTFPFGSFSRTWKPVEVQFFGGLKVVHLWTWQPQSPMLSKMSRAAYYLMMPLLAIVWMTFNWSFDVVIASSGTSPLVWLPGLVAKRFLNRSLVIDVRDLPVDSAISLGFLKTESFATRMLKLFEKACFLYSDFVSVPTNSVRKGVLFCGVEENKVLLIPNAADTDIFYPRDVPKKRQVVFAGNIGYAQDFDCVLTAMKEVSKKRIKLLAVGEGELKEQLQRQVSESQLDESVVLLGGVPRTELPAILSASIAGLAPLKKLDVITDSIPAKVFDYMACAIPFIAFGGQDLKTIVEQSGSGFVIENDCQLLAKIILFLADNPAIASKMGASGREYCEKFYNRRAMAKKIESRLLSL